MLAGNLVVSEPESLLAESDVVSLVVPVGDEPEAEGPGAGLDVGGVLRVGDAVEEVAAEALDRRDGDDVAVPVGGAAVLGHALEHKRGLCD